MDRERGPAGGQRGQCDACLECSGSGAGAGFAREILIANVGRVSDHRGVPGLGRNQKEISDGDVGISTGPFDPSASDASAMRVDLDAIDTRSWGVVTGEVTEASDRLYEEGGVAS